MDLRKSLPTDWLGIDPYLLRQNKRTPKVPADQSLEETIRTCNLYPHPEIPPTAVTHPTEENVVPDLIHFIWLGERELGAKKVGKENILSFKNKNPEKITIVWTNTTDPATGEKLPQSVLDERINWCRDNNIVLLDLDDVFAGRYDLEAAFMREMLRPNFGSASDILRIVILEKFGGTYCDIDTRCLEALGKILAQSGIKINAKPRGVTERFNSFHGTPEFKTTTNDLIMAVAHAPELQKILKDMKERYLIKNAEVCNLYRDAWCIVMKIP